MRNLSSWFYNLDQPRHFNDVKVRMFKNATDYAIKLIQANLEVEEKVKSRIISTSENFAKYPYKEGKLLGEGAYGSCYKAEDENGNQYVAKH